MAPKHTKSTATAASKSSHQVIHLRTKLKAIKDYEDGKSVMVIVHQSGMAHSTIATTLKHKDKVTEAAEGSASSKAISLMEIQERPLSDTKKLLMTWMKATEA